ncbi:MAG: hypothetical protein CMI31_05990 [Opitutae bacterium]|nr:hypothetical protein [Opitutae bacterium]|tara:strand:+ start:1012 stop:2304 length:1293 start_codon:yes stop_codon:yes gene_type:complete
MKEHLKRLSGKSRRDFITNTAKACLGVSILPTLSEKGFAVTPGKRPATARHVIYLYMGGGMSHVDTLDPKPENPAVQGPVKAIRTSADGIRLSEFLPNTAKQMHNAALIRSVSTNQGAHEQANYLMHTSYVKRGTIVHPTLGSWVSKMSGKINATLPENIRVNGGSNILGAGFLESKHGPLPIGNPSAGLQNSEMAEHLTNDRFGRRLLAAEKLNANFLDSYPQRKVRAYSDLYKEAIKLMKSEDLKAFDLEREPKSSHTLYGQHKFGQGCLLARRLIENKVRYVEVSMGGWDTHDDNFQRVADNCIQLDQGLGGLLYDLERRGLLKETMVVLTSDFGRTPDIVGARQGRNHWPKAFSALMAGGGIKGGMVYGNSDKDGKEVAENLVKVPDLNATIAYALGLPLTKVMYSPSGRPFTVAHKGEPVLDVLV